MKHRFPASFSYSYNENLPSKGSIFREKVSLFEISYRNSTTKSDTFGRSEILGERGPTVRSHSRYSSHQCLFLPLGGSLKTMVCLYIHISFFCSKKKTDSCLPVQVVLMLDLTAGDTFYATYALGKAPRTNKNDSLVVSEVIFE